MANAVEMRQMTNALHGDSVPPPPEQHPATLDAKARRKAAAEKTTLCKYIRKQRSAQKEGKSWEECPDGANCKFAHDESELPADWKKNQNKKKNKSKKTSEALVAQTEAGPQLPLPAGQVCQFQKMQCEDANSEASTRAPDSEPSSPCSAASSSPVVSPSTPSAKYQPPHKRNAEAKFSPALSSASTAPGSGVFDPADEEEEDEIDFPSLELAAQGDSPTNSSISSLSQVTVEQACGKGAAAGSLLLAMKALEVPEEASTDKPSTAYLRRWGGKSWADICEEEEDDFSWIQRQWQQPCRLQTGAMKLA